MSIYKCVLNTNMEGRMVSDGSHFLIAFLFKLKIE
jgi:hypothetical protein